MKEGNLRDTDLSVRHSFASFLAETNWLLVALLVPVAFEPQATYHFVPIKSAVLHLAGFVAWAALLLGVFEARGRLADGGKKVWGSAAFFPVVALLGWLAVTWVSQVFSVEPQRVLQTHGMASWSFPAKFSEAGLLLSIAFFLRGRERCERLARALLAGGIPVAIFAVLQRYGISYSGMVTIKKGLDSFAGGPIFLGGFLVLLVPLALWKFWGVWDAGRRASRLECGKKGGGCAGGTSTFWVYFALLVLFSAAFLVTEKRGPLLALFGGMVFSVSLLALWNGKGLWLRRAFWVGGSGALILLSLALLQKMNVPLDGVRWAQKLASIVPVGKGTGDPFRHSLWSAMPEVVFGEGKQWGFVDGGEDLHSALRFWVGHGPDTVEAVLPFYWIYLPVWPRPIIDFSAHSMLWDAFLMLGVSGFCFVLLFHGFLFWSGLPPLPGGRRSSGKTDFVFALAGVLVGGAVLGWIYHGGYAFLGASFGLLAGLLASYFWQGKREGGGVLAVGRGGLREVRLLRLVVLCSLAGFWIDMVFVFPTGNTNAIFWVLAGWVIALRRAEEEPAGWEEAFVLRRYWQGVWPALACAASGAALVSAFVQAPLAEPVSSFPFLGGKPLAGALLALLFFPSAFLSAKVLGEEKGGWLRLVGFGILGGLVFVVAKVWWLAPALPPGDAFSGGGHLSETAAFRLEWSPFLLLAMFVAALLVACGIVLRGRGLAKGLAVVVAGCFVWFFFAKEPVMLRAEALAKFLKYRLAPPEFRDRIFRECLALIPGNSKVWTDYARDLQGRQSGGETAIHRVHPVWQEGIRKAPNSYFSFVAGEVYARAAHGASDPISRSVFAGQAFDAFGRAVRYIPQNEAAWTNAAAMSEHFLFDSGTARPMRLRADELLRHAPEQIVCARAGSWGIYYADQARIFSGGKAGKDYCLRAICLLRRAVFLEARGRAAPSALPLEVKQALFFFYFRLAGLLEGEGLFLPAAMGYFGAEWFRPNSVGLPAGEFARRALSAAEDAPFSFRENEFLFFGFLADSQKSVVPLGESGEGR